MQTRITACVLLAVFILTGVAYPQEADAPSMRLQVGRLTSSFRSARGDIEKQTEIVDQAIELGPEAAGEIKELLEKEAGLALKKYGDDFRKQAIALIQNRVRMVGMKEVARCQQAIAQMQKSPELDKDTLKRKGDQTVRRLRQILTVTPEEVVGSSKTLAEARAELLAKGELWDRCATFVHAKTPDPEEGEKPPAPSPFKTYLAKHETAAAESSLILSTGARKVLAANAGLSRRIDPEEARSIHELNMLRVLVGRNPLLIDLRLTAAARGHSKDMKTEGFFAHESPLPGKKSFSDRAKRAGTTASGENIFMGSTSGAAAHNGWFHSPGHFKNMLGNHRRVGVGRYEKHYTQMFGR